MNNYKILLFLILSVNFTYSQKTDSLSTKKIEEVNVKGKKKPFEQTEKGIILNVSGSELENKDNALRILSFAPTVSGTTVLGSDRVQIILNGKEVKISTIQLKNFLTSIDAKSIRTIEVNDRMDASADSKYDAQIVINTRRVEGIQASAKTGTDYRAGKFGKNFDGTLIAHFNKLRVYTSGNYWDAFSVAHGVSVLNIRKDIFRDGTSIFTLKRQGYNATFNLDYDFNEHTSLSFLYNYTVDKDLNKKRNVTYHVRTAKVSDSLITLQNRYQNLDDTHTFSLQFVHKPDDKGSVITLNTDYATDYFRVPFHSISDYENADSRKTVDMQQNSKLYYGIFTTSADYKKILNDRNQLDFGLKYSYSANLNVLDCFLQNKYENERSQRFNMFENLYAAYIKYILKTGKLSYTFGIRSESTSDQFRNRAGSAGSQQYTNFLPTLMASMPINKNNVLYFYLGKKIQRPSFFSYDPTVFFKPPNEYSTGNEYLKPRSSYVAQTGYTYRQKYSTVLQYTYTVNSIVYIPKTIENGMIFNRPENAGFLNRLHLNISSPVKFSDFWTSHTKLNFIYQDFRLPETNTFYKSLYFQGQSTQSFHLPAKISLDVNLSYTSPYRSQYIYQFGSFTSSAYLSIPIWKENARISFSIDDLFNTERSKEYSDINGIYSYEYQKFRSRTVSLSFSYYFKSGKEINDEVRDSGVQEQLNRTGR